jgi:hypothetical protein
MLNLFRRKKSEKQNLHLDKAAAFFARNIIRTQTRIATWLSKYEQHMTIQQKKIALFFFCISMSIFAGSFLYRGVTGFNTSSPAWLQQPSIVIPETHPLPDFTDLQALNQMGVTRDTVRLKTDSTHH